MHFHRVGTKCCETFLWDVEKDNNEMRNGMEGIRSGSAKNIWDVEVIPVCVQKEVQSGNSRAKWTIPALICLDHANNTQYHLLNLTNDYTATDSAKYSSDNCVNASNTENYCSVDNDVQVTAKTTTKEGAISGL